LKVALFISSFLSGKGGAEKVAAKVANLLSRNKIQTSVISGTSNSRTDPYELEPEVNLIVLARSDECGWMKLRGKFDLLIGFAMAGLYADIVYKASLLNCPYVIQECSNPDRMVTLMAENQKDKNLTTHEASWLRQSILAGANAIRLTVPDYEETVMEASRPFTYAFYNSLEAPNMQNIELGKRPKKIVAVGALKTKNKNGISGAKAFIKSEVYEQGWSLHFYGKNAFPDELKNLQKQAGGDCIFDHGISTDQNEMYADASLLLIPSIEEGLPNVVVEAFGYGMPAIGFKDCPGTNHLIKHGKRGILVNGFSEELMAEQINHICTNTEDRVRMGKSANQFARENFTNEMFEKNWLRLVQNAVNGKNRDNKKSPLPIETLLPIEAREALANLIKYYKITPDISA